MISIMSQSSYPAANLPPMGQLVLNLRKPSGLGSAAMITPLVKIDGYPAPVRWDRNAFPVTPGEHQLHVSSNYLWEFGAAELPVVVPPGQSVEVHYSGPMVTFMRGKIGFSPQPRPGTAIVWALIAVPVLVVLIILIASTTG